MVMMQCRQVGIYTQPNLQTQPLEQMYKDFLAGDQLLGNEGSNGDHGQSAIVQLLALHVLPSLRVGGEETQGVESKVARLVVVSQGVEILGSRSSPSQTHSVCLAQTNSEQKWLPEHSTAGFNLLEMVDSRTCATQHYQTFSLATKKKYIPFHSAISEPETKSIDLGFK